MKVFTSLKIGSAELPNRLIMAPVKTGYGTPEGNVTSRHEAYYRRRANGGVAAIIVEPLYIDIIGKEHPRQLGISSSSRLDGLKGLITAIHEGGALAIAHLNHGGRAANPKASGATPEAPSPVKCQLTGITPDPMSEERIGQVIVAFAGAAGRAVEAGFDMIELQFGLGYLVAQFLSPATNLRQDGYGGDKNSRRRFAGEVLQAVRNEVGIATPIMTRISASEQVTSGLGIDDALEFATYLAERGVDALHVVSGSICDSPAWYFQHMRLPLGKNLEWAGLIRKQVEVPVITAGRLGNPDDIRQALDAEIVDGIALGRPLIADPDLPTKMKESHDEDILQCGACLQGCLGKVRSGEGLGCIVNPEVGHEFDELARADRPKTVIVIGGGPGGMQAALTASQRGHKVTLFDKDELGGQFKLSFLPPGKEMMSRPLDSLVRRVKKSEINLRLCHEATAEEVIAIHPDVAVVATGSKAILPSIIGLDNPLTGEDILTGRQNAGKRVLIIGGGSVGLESAEFLARDGHLVTIVELLDDIARDMLPITKKLTLKALGDSRVRIFTGTEVTRFDGNRAFVSTEGSEQLLGEFDSVVVAVGASSVNALEPRLYQAGIDVRTVGDAVRPRQIYDAVKDGYDAAMEI